MPTLTEIRGAVRQFSYRTASVIGDFTILPRKLLADLERQLAEQAGADEANHTVYEVTQEDGRKLYLMFTDFNVRVGHTILEERW